VVAVEVRRPKKTRRVEVGGCTSGFLIAVWPEAEAQPEVVAFDSTGAPCDRLVLGSRTAKRAVTPGSWFASAQEL